MKAYYNILDKIEAVLEANDYVNEVRRGTVEEVDFGKTSLYSLGHFNITNVTYNGSTYLFTVSLLVMDIVSQLPTEEVDNIYNKTNEEYVLNETLNVVTEVVRYFVKGEGNRDGYKSSGTINLEAFRDRFNDDVAGWVTTFEIEVPNTSEYC